MLILDSTVGFRKMWHGNRNGIIGLDIRRECKPEVVGDIKFLPFIDRVFDGVYFDPPHHVPAKNYMFNIAFGEGLTPEQRVRLFYEANKEFARVLKPNGFLFCKTTDMPKNRGFSSKYMREALKQILTNFVEYSHNSRHSKKSKTATVSWTNYRKIVGE